MSWQLITEKEIEAILKVCKKVCSTHSFSWNLNRIWYLVNCADSEHNIGKNFIAHLINVMVVCMIAFVSCILVLTVDLALFRAWGMQWKIEPIHIRSKTEKTKLVLGKQVFFYHKWRIFKIEPTNIVKEYLFKICLTPVATDRLLAPKQACSKQPPTEHLDNLDNLRTLCLWTKCQHGQFVC